MDIFSLTPYQRRLGDKYSTKSVKSKKLYQDAKKQTLIF